MLWAYIDCERGLWHIRKDRQRREWLLQRAAVGRKTQTVALFDCQRLAELNLKYLASALGWSRIRMPREGCNE